MALTVELSSKIISKVDLQHPRLGFGKGILEEDARRISLDPRLLGIEHVRQADHQRTGIVPEKVPFDRDIYSARRQGLPLRHHICRTVIPRQLERIDLE